MPLPTLRTVRPWSLHDGKHHLRQCPGLLHRFFGAPSSFPTGSPARLPLRFCLVPIVTSHMQNSPTRYFRCSAVIPGGLLTAPLLAVPKLCWNLSTSMWKGISRSISTMSWSKHPSRLARSSALCRQLRWSRFVACCQWRCLQTLSGRRQLAHLNEEQRSRRSILHVILSTSASFREFAAALA